jgi:hypothetical protein
MDRRGVLARKLATARRQPLFVLLWVLPAWALIGLSSAVIALVPFRRIAPWLGSNLGAVAVKPPVNAVQQRRALLIAQTIELAGRYAWFRADCYPQALTARVLCVLWRVPCAIHFGVTIGSRDDAEDRKLRAHAWACAGNVIVSGGTGSFATNTVVVCFGPAALKPA